MSKHHVQTSVLHDVQVKTIDELESQYGIQVTPETGEVWDSCEFKTFDNITEWAKYIASLDDEYDQVTFSKMEKVSRYDY